MLPSDSMTIDGAALQEIMLPAWHKRPTCPGLWVCWEESQPEMLFTISAPLIRMTQMDIDRGCPFATAAVFGPIPEPPEGTPMDLEIRKKQEQKALTHEASKQNEFTPARRSSITGAISP